MDVIEERMDDAREQKHLRLIEIPSATSQALALLREERDAARAEAAHYQTVLQAIETRAKQEYDVYPKGDILIALKMIEVGAHRALMWESRERKRTWRDRVAAWWTTKLAMLWARRSK